MKITNIKFNNTVIPFQNSFNTEEIKDKETLNNTLPYFLDKFLIGIMLGDGNISRSSLTSNSRFEMSFGQKYKEYAESIGKLFIDYVPESSKTMPIKTVELKLKDKVYTNYRFKTASLPIFNKYHSLFYKMETQINLDSKNSVSKRSSLRNIKIIPSNILDLLDPISLAYLIMSDGNYDKSRNRVRIYTNSYSKEEVDMLSKALNTKFGIYTAILHDRKDQWIITIGATQLDSLRNLVSPYFHPTLLYRIGILEEVE